MTLPAAPIYHVDNSRRCGKCPHLWGTAYSQWCDLYHHVDQHWLKYDVKCRPVRCPACLKAEVKP